MSSGFSMRMMCSFRVRSNMWHSFFKSHPECDMAMGNGYKIDGRGAKDPGTSVARDFSVRRFFYGEPGGFSSPRSFEQGFFAGRQDSISKIEHAGTGNCSSRSPNLGAKSDTFSADLGGFRIHEASISGSGRMNEQYQRRTAEESFANCVDMNGKQPMSCCASSTGQKGS